MGCPITPHRFGSLKDTLPVPHLSGPLSIYCWAPTTAVNHMFHWTPQGTVALVST